MAPTAWDFIEQYAVEQGVKKLALEKWRLRGVPHRYRLPIARAAAQSGIALDDRDFTGHPRYRPSTATARAGEAAA